MDYHTKKFDSNATKINKIAIDQSCFFGMKLMHPKIFKIHIHIHYKLTNSNSKTFHICNAFPPNLASIVVIPEKGACVKIFHSKRPHCRGQMGKNHSARKVFIICDRKRKHGRSDGVGQNTRQYLGISNW